MRRRIPLLLTCACALIFPASIIRSELTGANPRDTFSVNIADDVPISLLQQIHILPAPRGTEIFYCLNAFRAFETESVASSPPIHVSPEPDDWKRLKSQVASAVANAQIQSITGPAEIRQNGLWTWLEVSDGKSHFKTSWVNPRMQLIPTHTYTFAVLFPLNTEPLVEKIFEEGRIIYDLSLCQVHDVQMDREEVPVSYSRGVRNYYPSAHSAVPSFDTRTQLFPNYVEVVYGGCTDEFEPTTMVYICPQCRAAFVRWEQEHRIRWIQ
jgi:hypothetical protein